MPEGTPVPPLHLPITGRSLGLQKAEDKGSPQHPNICTVEPHKEQLDTQKATKTLSDLLFSQKPLNHKGSRVRKGSLLVVGSL